MTDSDELELMRIVLSCVGNCVHLLSNGMDSADVVLLRLESLHELLLRWSEVVTQSWIVNAVQIAEEIIQVLTNEDNGMIENLPVRGRPQISINMPIIEFLLSQRFSVVTISKILGVSRQTVFRRMSAKGLTVSASYSIITDVELQSKVREILAEFPVTGYKRMKGFLFSRGIRVSDYRVRDVMRKVDPEGVMERTLSNRAIVRRQYFVTYFNELWHLDTNLKLIRWKIVVRSCIDGRSRLLTYLDASGDNRADTNLKSFMAAVANYDIPQRTRSDKGGENVLIAQFMIERRGVGRASHICGRSVHNQRIERFWRDAFYGILGNFYNVFTQLEHDGYLNIDSEKHLAILHHVFIPRLNLSLASFMEAWNHHPLSSESNYSPTQLMLMTLPPPHLDVSLNSVDLSDVQFVCGSNVDLAQFQDEETFLDPNSCLLTEAELSRLSLLNVTRDSDAFGSDIFVEALQLVESE